MREVVALLLAGVLLVAGGAKLVDATGTRRSVRELGLPTRFGWPIAIALPLVELMLAGGLLLTHVSRAAAAAASALLVGFAVILGIARSSGRAVDCHCFGALHSGPSGRSTIARNVVLALAAVGVAATPAAPVRLWDVVVAAAIALAAAQAVAWHALLRRYGRALARIDELSGSAPSNPRLAVGASAPGFAVPSIAGHPTTLSALLERSRPVLLVFVHPGCEPCRALMPQLGRWQREAEALTIAAVSSGDPALNAELAAEHELEEVLLQEGSELADLYGADATPSGVLIEPDGRIGRELVIGGSRLAELVESFSARAEPSQRRAQPTRAAVKVGAAATAALTLGTDGLAMPASHGAARPSRHRQNLQKVVDAMHRDLDVATEEIFRALRALEPPERPGVVVAPRLAKAIAAAVARVEGARASVRDLSTGDPVEPQILAYLSALRAGLQAFEQAGKTRSLAEAARDAATGRVRFRRAAALIRTIDRSLGCPYGCHPPRRVTP